MDCGGKLDLMGSSPPLHFSSTDFNLFHMIAVGLSSSILGCLVTLLVYSYCQRYQQQAHDATVIHPISPVPLNTSITNHINKLDKYDSVEAIKVRLLICSGFPPPFSFFTNLLIDTNDPRGKRGIRRQSLYCVSHCVKSSCVGGRALLSHFGAKTLRQPRQNRPSFPHRVGGVFYLGAHQDFSVVLCYCLLFVHSSPVISSKSLFFKEALH